MSHERAPEMRTKCLHIWLLSSSDDFDGNNFSAMVKRGTKEYSSLLLELKNHRVFHGWKRIHSFIYSSIQLSALAKPQSQS